MRVGRYNELIWVWCVGLVGSRACLEMSCCHITDSFVRTQPETMHPAWPPAAPTPTTHQHWDINIITTNLSWVIVNFHWNNWGKCLYLKFTKIFWHVCSLKKWMLSQQTPSQQWPIPVHPCPALALSSLVCPGTIQPQSQFTSVASRYIW